ncbi:hypothetical protein KP509_16G051500 [Ceratopteris richardii]|uniref:alpha,alpha-trehalose-phosphate synthase (UDP-forming) n=1 Tax=Ceratopteris richardii TaxID=49495 RepID=A0A8T2T2Z4_CERRI|nr:hypothetical protein KP509_16G051500 [Ceratopteris richardii]
MSSRSYSNLLELTSDFPAALPRSTRRLPKVMTEPGILSELRDDDNATSVTSESASSLSQGERCIIAANILPLNAEKTPKGWIFSYDSDSLLLQLKDGLPQDMEVLYVGCLKVEIEPSEQDEVASYLLENFRCAPVFLSSDLRNRFYHGFCKQQLWPLFHYMLPLTPDHGGRFDRSQWQAYVSVNKSFSAKVMQVINPDDDYVWVHDYHLVLLPTFLRKKWSRVKLGFFLHSPFPSSEIYRTLPVRDEMLRALLNADVIGFHTFDYARHFLSCCRRLLGLEYESKRGYIGLEYYGRTVSIKIMPVGIHMGKLQENLNLSETKKMIAQLSKQFQSKAVLLGVDDMDIFKGIGLKLLAMEQLLKDHPELRGKVVMVQIANPARSHGKDVLEVQTEAYDAVERINQQYGGPDYEPVVLIGRHVPISERIAYYTVAECCVVTAVRDGMNLIPYEYIVSREGCTYPDARVSSGPRKSMLIVSEFIGCSPSLSGAIRVNPWNVDILADALNMSIKMPEAEKRMRHEKHYRYVSTHDVAYWAQSFMGDLERSCRDHARRRSWGIGFGLSFRVMALDPNFRKLSPEHIASAYRRTSRRAIIVDYDGTLMPQTCIDKTPSSAVLHTLDVLCSDPKNVVFIVSGRGRRVLSEWFSSCKKLGLSAEHGYFYRWHGDAEWETSIPPADFCWKDIAEPVMQLYTETTDGSYIEVKESALVWHHQEADLDFGSWQAKELLDHLESVLANEPVTVKSGQYIVEVKPQGVNKGVVAEKLLTYMAAEGSPPDFVLCCGDDRSDEDMFESIANAMAEPPQIPMAEVFACTVGRKPSKAKYYLDDTGEVIKMLENLASVTRPAARVIGHVSFESSLL